VKSGERTTSNRVSRRGQSEAVEGRIVICREGVMVRRYESER